MNIHDLTGRLIYESQKGFWELEKNHVTVWDQNYSLRFHCRWQLELMMSFKHACHWQIALANSVNVGYDESLLHLKSIVLPQLTPIMHLQIVSQLVFFFFCCLCRLGFRCLCRLSFLLSFVNWSWRGLKRWSSWAQMQRWALIQLHDMSQDIVDIFELILFTWKMLNKRNCDILAMSLDKRSCGSLYP